MLAPTYRLSAASATPKPEGYAKYVQHIKLKRPLCCPFNFPDFNHAANINLICSVTPDNIRRKETEIGNMALLLCYINSPLHTYTAATDYSKMLTRLEKKRNKRGMIAELRGYYFEQYTSTKKLIGGKNNKPEHVHVFGKTKQMYERQQALNTEYLQNTFVHTIDFKGLVREFCLADVTKSSEQRCAEIYAEMRMVEEIAKREGLISLLATLTATPGYHPNPSVGRCSWNGSSSREALAFINAKVWRVIYNEATKKGIRLLGFAVPEPHKDGCPHLHVALFVHPNQHKALYRILIKTRKKIAKEHNCPHYKLDIYPHSRLPEHKKGSKASSYAMKYVFKSFTDPAVAAWYSKFNGKAIRRYRLIGVSSFKTKYNYLVKMLPQLKMYNHQAIKQLVELLENKNMPEHLKKVAFYDHFNRIFKSVYVESDSGEYLKFSHVILKTGDEELNIVNMNRLLNPENAEDACKIAEFNDKKEEGEKDNATTEQAPGALVLNLSRCAGASPDTLKKTEINAFWTHFGDDEEVINLLDI